MKPLVILCLVALPLLTGTPATAALRFFPDRTSFAVANPNLTLEDFETAVAPPGPFGNGLNISEPLDSTTNNGVFHPGDLVDGIRFSTTAEGGFDLVLYPPTVTFATFPSQVLGTPGRPYNLVIDFTAGNVFAVGMDVFSLPNLNAEVLVDIFGASGLLGHTRITSSLVGGFSASCRTGTRSPTSWSMTPVLRGQWTISHSVPRHLFLITSPVMRSPWTSTPRQKARTSRRTKP
jgi:hypothetical protein